MNYFSIVAMALIASGALVMAVNVIKFRSILPMLEQFAIEGYGTLKRFFFFHQILMVFFLFGYIVVFFSIIAKIKLIGDLFIGVIFFFGSIFVLLGILLQSRMLASIGTGYERIRNLSHKLEQEQARLMKTNEQMKNEIEVRKHVDKALQESEIRLKTILDSIPTGIVIINPETHMIMDANPSAIKTIGAPKEKIIGYTCHHYICPAEKGACPISNLGQQLDNSERILLKANGEKVPILKTVTPVILSGMRCLLEIFVDITTRKQAEEALRKAHELLEIRVQERTEELTKTNEQLRYEIGVRQAAEAELLRAKEAAESANRAKSEFLANMSHELRTPLNHIIGFTELVVDKNFGDLNEAQKEYLTDVLQSSRHLLSLINDILDLSKVESGKMELEPTEINIKGLVENSLTMVKEKALKHGIRLSADMSEIPETITVDERKFKQIIYNLLSNAVKFTPDGGKISVSLRKFDGTVRPGLRQWDPEDLRIIDARAERRIASGTMMKKYIEFSVSDTGIGIRPEDRERIFRPFEQAETSISRRYQGTGLGLSLTKNLIELHGGTIWAESEGEGKGSKFTFLIPI